MAKFDKIASEVEAGDLVFFAGLAEAGAAVVRNRANDGGTRTLVFDLGTGGLVEWNVGASFPVTLVERGEPMIGGLA